MRRAVVTTVLTGMLMVVPLTGASADHTGCEPHSRTDTAHDRVPHNTDGNHTADDSIPYCPPDDAPRHQQDDGGDH